MRFPRNTGLMMLAAVVSRVTAADLNEVVVTAPKDARTADERVERDVAAALANDRYLLGDHITVTIRNGVATLHGIVFDDWDLRNALRTARHVTGVRRVVNQLEIKLGGE